MLVAAASRGRRPARAGRFRLAVLTFHSLEDARVKRFLDAARGKVAPRDRVGQPDRSGRLLLRPSPRRPVRGSISPTPARALGAPEIRSEGSRGTAS
jgi:hypothetical protein